MSNLFVARGGVHSVTTPLPGRSVWRTPSVWVAAERVGNLAAVVLLMRSRSWRVSVIPTGSLTSVSEQPPDIIVIDKGVHAFVFAQKLRSWFMGPVVVLTSLRLPAVSAEARNAGCTCVTTPCRAPHVVACIYSALAMASETWPRGLDAISAESSGPCRTASDCNPPCFLPKHE